MWLSQVLGCFVGLALSEGSLSAAELRTMKRTSAPPARIRAAIDEQKRVAQGPIAADPREIGHTPQLFIDESLLVFSANVLRSVHPAIKSPQPVLAADPSLPWEDGGEGNSKRLCIYGTVIKEPLDSGLPRFRMWYMGRMGPPGVSPPHHIPVSPQATRHLLVIFGSILRGCV
jgi:hypothetical protein